VAPVNTTRSALHAKCIVIDGREALVTSANFTEAAQERNIELGLLVRSAEIASRIERHFQAPRTP
jgi:phosphatidylserine/phosphatidylglycerophosphate/cardiolipin synthase-like enzyme